MGIGPLKRAVFLDRDGVLNEALVREGKPYPPASVADLRIVADAPEALIYEPQPDGSMRLVGVEFILFAANWAAAHPEGGAPKLEGHLMNLVGAPNRYGLDAFYELHVWAWEDNPEGSFADWNTKVTCENQPLD